jgi:hypothetical protein
MIQTLLYLAASAGRRQSDILISFNAAVLLKNYTKRKLIALKSQCVFNKSKMMNDEL